MSVGTAGAPNEAGLSQHGGHLSIELPVKLFAIYSREFLKFVYLPLSQAEERAAQGW